jgi:hypothetical protein
MIFFGDPLSSNLHTTSFFLNKVDGFPKLYRLYTSSFYVTYIFRYLFDDNVSSPGLYGGLYGQNLPYKFKNLYVNLRNLNFEKSHRTTGPRSDLRPNPWRSWANYGLDSSFTKSKPKVFELRPGVLNKRTVPTRTLKNSNDSNDLESRES